MVRREIETFLSHLAVQERVAASTQNQALSTILFLYRDVLQQELELPINAVRAKQSHYLPTVVTKGEVLAVIRQLSGIYQLIARLFGVADLGYKSFDLQFLEPRPKLTFRYMQNWHSYLD